MNNKEQRHQALIDIIAQGTIETQTDLVSQIQELGFKVTQTTISRDIEALRIVKGSKGYELPSDLSDDPKWVQGVKQHGQSIQAVGDHLLVLKTDESAAQIVASQMDQEQIKGLVGTIAGIDTVFLAVESKEDQMRIEKKIQVMMKFV